MANEDRMQLRETAREGALQYDADLITNKYWVPALKTIEDKLKDFRKEKSKNSTPVTKASVTPNRAQRRRASKAKV
jgi:hypothetical protein